jgi:hypothetical protein
MARSSNGWVVLDSGTTGPPLRHWQIPTVNRKLMLRDGSAGFLLVHLAMWFDQKVERLDAKEQYDDWAYAKRPVRGAQVYSNHASGTAIDLNATKHPMGVATRSTFSNAEIEKIHARLRFYRGTIRWGGDYQNRPDAMHFELNKGIASVESLARTLSTSPRGKAVLAANPGAKALIFS